MCVARIDRRIEICCKCYLQKWTNIDFAGKILVKVIYPKYYKNRNKELLRTAIRVDEKSQKWAGFWADKLIHEP